MSVHCRSPTRFKQTHLLWQMLSSDSITVKKITIKLKYMLKSMVAGGIKSYFRNIFDWFQLRAPVDKALRFSDLLGLGFRFIFSWWDRYRINMSLFNSFFFQVLSWESFRILILFPTQYKLIKLIHHCQYCRVWLCGWSFGGEVTNS